MIFYGFSNSNVLVRLPRVQTYLGGFGALRGRLKTHLRTRNDPILMCLSLRYTVLIGQLD